MTGYAVEAHNRCGVRRLYADTTDVTASASATKSVEEQDYFETSTSGRSRPTLQQQSR